MLDRDPSNALGMTGRIFEAVDETALDVVLFAGAASALHLDL
jgi:hypothetical protein